MHYYMRNIGDYAKATQHLNNIEDLAYRRMIDMYYDQEKPLTLDIKALARLLNLRESIEEISNVLADFFVKTTDGYFHTEISKSIEEYKGKADRARSNGKMGGRPRKKEEKNPEKTTLVSKKTQKKPDCNPEETGLKANHKPVTNNQEPNIKDQETHVSSKLDTCALESDCEVIPAKKNKPKEKKPEYPDEFEWLWENKPSREGGNPKKKALSACKARLKQGHTWREMAEGLQRYKKYCDSTKITGSRVVQMMSTFFGTGLAFTEAWAYAKDRDINKKSSLADRILERAIEENQRNGLTPATEKSINEPASKPTRDNNGFSQWADNNTRSVVYDNDGSGIPANMETRDTTGLLDMDAFVFGVGSNKASNG